MIFKFVQLFDLFKNTVTSTSKPQKATGGCTYPNSGQMRKANLAGEPPVTFIQAHPTPQKVNMYINMCDTRLKEYRTQDMKLATGEAEFCVSSYTRKQIINHTHKLINFGCRVAKGNPKGARNRF